MPTTLDQTPVGTCIRIEAIPDQDDLMTMIRMGFSQGSLCTVLSRVPGGPVVVQQGLAEMALGRALCQRIFVESVSR